MKDDAARYKLRAGMAKTALRLKHSKLTDAYGKPLRAQEMADRHSTKTLSRWAKNKSKRIIVSV